MEITHTTYSPRATSKPPVRIMKFEKLCSDFQVFFVLRNCYPNYLEDIVSTFNIIRKRFKSQKSEYRKNLLRKTILCMQNSTVSTHYGPCATPKCVTPKAATNKI